MANLSDQTRKQQVLRYLQVRPNQWVDGPELSNEKVGGSEGVRRLRELRADGWSIETRKHPDPKRDIWQYRYVPSAPSSPSSPDSPSHDVDAGLARYTRPPTKLAFGEAIPCPRCDGKGKRVDPVVKKFGPCTRCNGFGIVPVPHV